MNNTRCLCCGTVQIKNRKYLNGVWRREKWPLSNYTTLQTVDALMQWVVDSATNYILLHVVRFILFYFATVALCHGDALKSCRLVNARRPLAWMGSARGTPVKGKQLLRLFLIQARSEAAKRCRSSCSSRRRALISTSLHRHRVKHRAVVVVVDVKGGHSNTRTVLGSLHQH